MAVGKSVVSLLMREIQAPVQPTILTSAIGTSAFQRARKASRRGRKTPLLAKTGTQSRYVYKS
jgi:hypothetical protein